MTFHYRQVRLYVHLFTVFTFQESLVPKALHWTDIYNLAWMPIQDNSQAQGLAILPQMRVCRVWDTKSLTQGLDCCPEVGIHARLYFSNPYILHLHPCKEPYPAHMCRGILILHGLGWEKSLSIPLGWIRFLVQDFHGLYKQKVDGNIQH